jgi:ferredoxin-type protein NapH
MPPTSDARTSRVRLLAKVLGTSHRYGKLRAFTLSVSIIALFAVPLGGLARFDVWGGDHWALGEPASPPKAFFAVLAGIVAFYGVTFVVNIFLGRLFCGWGCPIGELSRLGDALAAQRTPVRGFRDRLRSPWIRGGIFSTLLSASVLAWWVSPRVFVDGSAAEILSTLGVLAALVGATYLHARYWRWRFCRQVCPIGLYYSVVTSKRTYGIAFHDELGTCKDCDLCAQVCPALLDPRHLDSVRTDVGGLAVEGLPASSHCLRCGDCVRTCEWVFRKEPAQNCPLRFDIAELGRPITRLQAVEHGRPVEQERRAQEKSEAAKN